MGCRGPCPHATPAGHPAEDATRRGAATVRHTHRVRSRGALPWGKRPAMPGVERQPSPAPARDDTCPSLRGSASRGRPAFPSLYRNARHAHEHPRRRSVLVRDLSAPHRCRNSGPPRDDPASRRGRPPVHLGDLRGGRVHRRPLAGARAAHPRDDGCRAAGAPHLRRHDLRERHPAHPRVPGCRHHELPRAARRPARRRLRGRPLPRRPRERRPARPAHRARADRARAVHRVIHPRRARAPRAWTVGATSRSPSRPSRTGTRARGIRIRTSTPCSRSRPPGRPSRSRSCSSTPRTTSASSSVRGRRASASRSCPASCRSSRPCACDASSSSRARSCPSSSPPRSTPSPPRKGSAPLGIAHAAALVREVVLGGAPGVHLYAFNHHDTVLAVLRDAGVLTQPSHLEAAR